MDKKQAIDTGLGSDQKVHLGELKGVIGEIAGSISLVDSTMAQLAVDKSNKQAERVVCAREVTKVITDNLNVLRDATVGNQYAVYGSAVVHQVHHSSYRPDGYFPVYGWYRTEVRGDVMTMLALQDPRSYERGQASLAKEFDIFDSVKDPELGLEGTYYPIAALHIDTPTESLWASPEVTGRDGSGYGSDYLVNQNGIRANLANVAFIALEDSATMLVPADTV